MLCFKGEKDLYKRVCGYGKCFTGSAVSQTGVYRAERQLLEVLHEINDCTKVKYHVIPFRSLGCDSGMLEVITADTMYICYGKKEIQVEDALIGLTAQTLSSDGEYEFLVNAQLLKG